MPNTSVTRLSAALVLATTLLLLSGEPVFAGAPLKGVDVKLGRNPGGTVARATTNLEGDFAFPAQTAGSYSLSFDLPSNALITVTIKAGSSTITRQFRTFSEVGSRISRGERRITFDLRSSTPISGSVGTALVKAK